MAHVLSVKRTWVFALVLAFHGLALMIAAMVWFVLSVRGLSSDSSHHVFRRPNLEEQARGRVWLAATTEARTVARPSVARTKPESSSPEARVEGEPGDVDPWGCSVRRQDWFSGKSSGWRDGPAWSYGAYLLHDPEGHEVRVPLAFLTSTSRTLLSPKQVKEMLPNEEAPGKVQYLRECFPEVAAISVDGYVDSAHVLVNGIDGEPAARFETLAAQRARARRKIALYSFGLVAFGAPFAWLAAWVALVRQPLVLHSAVASVFPLDASGLWKSSLAGAAFGALLGALALSTGRVSPIVLVASAGLFGVAAMLAQSLRLTVGALDTFRRLLARGQSSSGALCRSGRLAAPVVATQGRLSGRSHAFAFESCFELSPKGAVGRRVSTASSHPRLEVEDGEGRFFVDTVTLEAFASENIEERLDAENLQMRGFDASVFVTGKRYLVRETPLEAGCPVTVLGPAISEADPLARGEDYREAGRSTVFVPGEPGRRRGPLLFALPRESLAAQASKDLTTFRFFQVLFGLWAMALPVPLAVALLLGRPD